MLSVATHDLDQKRIRAPRGEPERGAAARYFPPSGTTAVYGLKVFHKRRTAISRWRAESLAAAAGLATMVVTPVRQVVRGSPARHIGYGYLVQHAMPIQSTSTDESLLPDVSRIKRLAREAGLTPPTDIRRENLGIVFGRVVLVDWGRDDTTRPVGRRG